MCVPAAGHPLGWAELLALQPDVRGRHIAYGSTPEEYGELLLPPGQGPFPVMLLVHGGCWLSEFDHGYLGALAQWLTTQGFAVWTVEFRRIGNAGGGWPGTLEDLGAAADALRGVARNTPLDLGHVYAGGHSSGGQLALWLAARGRMPQGSSLRTAAPLPIRGVLGLSAITDLDSYRVGPPGSCNAAVDDFLGGSPQTVPERYAKSSPSRLLPLGVPQVFVHGDLDGIVDEQSVRDYVAAAQAAGDSARLFNLPDAGHFDPVAPTARNMPALKAALDWLRARTGS